MAHLVVGGVCRFTLDMTYGDRPAHTVLDMHIYDRDVVTSRHDAILDQAGVLNTQWGADVGEHLTPHLTLDSVSWVDLDTDDGKVGSIDGTTAGTDDTTCFPGNVAVLVTKVV